MELYLIFVDFFGVRCDLEEDGLESNQFIVQFVVLMSRLQDNIPISNENVNDNQRRNDQAVDFGVGKLS